MEKTTNRKIAGPEDIADAQALLKALAFGDSKGLTREQKIHYEKARAAYRQKLARFGFRAQD